MAGQNQKATREETGGAQCEQRVNRAHSEQDKVQVEEREERGAYSLSTGAVVRDVTPALVDDWTKFYHNISGNVRKKVIR